MDSKDLPAGFEFVQKSENKLERNKRANILPLGGSYHASVTQFRGAVFLNIRVYQRYSEGLMVPKKEGISLRFPEAMKLFSIKDVVKSGLRKDLNTDEEIRVSLSPSDEESPVVFLYIGRYADDCLINICKTFIDSNNMRLVSTVVC